MAESIKKCEEEGPKGTDVELGATDELKSQDQLIDIVPLPDGKESEGDSRTCC